MFLHSDLPELGGRYWLHLQSLTFPNTTLELKHFSRPTHAFGQPLSSIYHASDVARIQILIENGGIYLDTDMMVVRSLDRFRHFEMAVGWPEKEYLGSQILVAHKDARFLKLWQNCYRRYHPREWYFNAGQLPTELILDHNPSLVHRVPYLFGVENLAAQLYGGAKWPQWRHMFAIHLLSRHPPAPQLTDEKLVRGLQSPYGEIARWILYKLDPVKEIL